MALNKVVINREKTKKPFPARAERAYQRQGIIDKDGKINKDYPGHDTFQNGIIPQGQETTLYFCTWKENAKGSGFLTDQATVDSCIHQGKLDSNELGDKLQIAKSRLNGPYEARSHCVAYDINWENMAALEEKNPALYKALTNPDGRSPDNKGIKCAFGKTGANPQHGNGGGNQYFITQSTFNRAVTAGVFQRNPDKSFSEDNKNLTRKAIPATKEKAAEINGKTNEVIKAEAKKPQKTADQINSDQVREDPKAPYIAKPDPAYGYGQDHSTQQGNIADRKEPKTDKEAENSKGSAKKPKNEAAGKNGEDSRVADPKGKDSTNRLPSKAADDPKKDTGASKEPTHKPKNEAAGKNGEDSRVDDPKNKDSTNRLPNKAADDPKKDTGASKEPTHKPKNEAARKNGEDSRVDDPKNKDSTNRLPNKAADDPKKDTEANKTLTQNPKAEASGKNKENSNTSNQQKPADKNKMSNTAAGNGKGQSENKEVAPRETGGSMPNTAKSSEPQKNTNTPNTQTDNTKKTNDRSR